MDNMKTGALMKSVATKIDTVFHPSKSLDVVKELGRTAQNTSVRILSFYIVSISPLVAMIQQSGECW